MKLKLFLIGVLGTALTASAQTMKVVQGQVTTLVPSASVGDMLFSEGGETFTVQHNTFSTASVSEILFDRSEVQPATLSVNYQDGLAQVAVSADIAPQLDIRVQGAHVSVWAAADLQQEVNYVLTGSSADGSFWMDGEYKATLTLDNLTLTNPDSAAVCIENGKRIAVVLPAGTSTTLADGAGGPQKACFFINGHAEFQGAGTLTLSGMTKHAYASDEYTLLTADFGQLNILQALSDGMHVDQYFQMDGGTVTIAGTQGDCIDVSVTKNAADEFNGQAFVNGGSLSLSVTADDVKGLKTENNLTVSGGSVYALVSGLGTKGFSVGTDLLINQASGQTTSISMDVTGTTYMPGDEVLESKCRGIKVKGNYTFDGGNISMNVTGKKAKGISCDGTYTYKSGTTNVIPE